MTWIAGCLSWGEKSVQIDPDASVRLDEPPEHVVDARAWLVQAHQRLRHLLPPNDPEALLTADLVAPDGEPADVFSHFRLRREDLQSLVRNFRGLRYTAQAAARDYYIDRPAPPWPDFEDIWIDIPQPIDPPQMHYSGRMGWARDAAGEIIEADCIVILPGLFGDHGVKRSRDLAIPLRRSGYHVVSLEVRGHGQTEARYPTMYHTFGVIETRDLMYVHDWLLRQPHVRRVGLVTYCWSGNFGLLAAWYDQRRQEAHRLCPNIACYLDNPDGPRPRFQAGILAFSPVLRWEVLMDELDRPRSTWKHPIFAAIQDTIRDRARRKGWPDPESGNLRRLVEYEITAYGVPLPGGAREGYPFLRLMDYGEEKAGDKLEAARVPVLIVHAADDPLVPAQDIADLIATVRNPRVAALILPSGGHVGFAGYAPDYYLSLIVNFFDHRTGPAGTDRNAAAAS